MWKTANLKRLSSRKKVEWHWACGISFTAETRVIMKFKQFVAANIGKKQAIYVTLLGLGFSGCTTTTSDLNYAHRNNIDAARSRCVELARSSGYQEVAVDSVERDGQAEWKVELVVKKDGKDRKERCEYNASTNRVRMNL
jgi:hypothetical protein